ncbi:prolyl oligopeptidase family serine peptidase [Marivita sp. S6314]|uniref:alpha/beta hydrolase family protein n=1 Tax=Marivita sp. S6314 TaxID=2926406 RepID=UPI001FF6DCE7|nr:alpha/beta fold hydrolase [Marivita sp. S6314]MCK0150447.1 prolyl oligopeptidase family serine peptidase [Marivita sp. S6314]
MRFLKWIFGSLVVLGVLAAGALAVWSRDTAPTHPVLAQADLPPIIPVRDFWADQRGEWDFKPSVDGTWLAWRAVDLATDVVRVGSASDKTIVTTLKDVDYYYWDDIKPELLAIIEGRLWRIDPTAPERDNWRDVTPRGFSNWFISNRVADGADPWLVASRDRNPAFADLYTTNQDGGDKRLLVENEGQTVGWMMSADLEPVMRIDRAEDGVLSYLVRDDTDWRVLTTLSVNTVFQIHEISPEADFALVVSARNRDKAALVRVDLQTGAETVVFAEDDEDIYDLVNLDPHDGVIDAVLTHVGTSDVHALTDRGAALRDLIHAKADRVEVNDLSWAGTGRFVTATLSPDALNYTYHLFDLETGQEQLLGTFSFRERYLDRLAPTEEVMIEARDGTELHALLVRPKGVDGPLPLVIEVHGGPALHLNWEYHHFRKFLANRGYAVLAVNYRGSTGFGLAFQSKGFGQFGRAMQDDLVDAANWAVSQGIADPAAIAVQGGSYGGYAAAMAMVRDADVFAAGIAEHAVLDVLYQMRNNPFAWGLTPEYTTRYFGDPDTPEDAEIMTTHSPVTRVSSLEDPMMVVAGKRDNVVGFEQSEAFLSAARAAGKDVEDLIFEDEGHGIHRWQNSIRHARRVEDFLAQHLGGRSGGRDWIEIAADLLD